MLTSSECESLLRGAALRVTRPRLAVLAAKDLDAAFERVQASGAEVVQEPAEQPYGVRDCAFRDPAGNMVRIQERG